MKNLWAYFLSLLFLMVGLASPAAEDVKPNLGSGLAVDAVFNDKDKALLYLLSNPSAVDGKVAASLRKLTTGAPTEVIRKQAFKVLFSAEAGSGWIGFGYLNNTDNWWASMGIRYVNKFPDADVCLGLLEKQTAVDYKSADGTWWLSALNYCRPKEVRKIIQSGKVEVTTELYANLWRGYVWRTEQKRRSVLKAKARYLEALKTKKKKPKKKRRFTVPRISKPAFIRDTFGRKTPAVAKDDTVTEIENRIRQTIEADKLACEPCKWQYDKPVADLELYRTAYTKWTVR